MMRSSLAALALAALLLASSTAQAQVIKQPPTPGIFKLRAGLAGTHPRLHFTSHAPSALLGVLLLVMLLGRRRSSPRPRQPRHH